MTISNNPPHKTIELDEGQSEQFEIFLARMRKEAEHRFTMAQTQMMVAAGDVELCIQLQMKLKGEPTADRHKFKTQREMLEQLRADETSRLLESST